jgi:hypothetical protein
MLEAMARIAPSQPNEAMARIASRRKVPFHSTPICRLLISVSAFNFRVDKEMGEKRGKMPPVTTTSHRSLQFDVQPTSDFSVPPL